MRRHPVITAAAAVAVPIVAFVACTATAPKTPLGPEPPAAIGKAPASAGPRSPAATGKAPGVPAGKPLAPSVEKGLAWLVERQHENGGFSQGEESANMGRTMDGVRDKPNVADTCMAALALIRAGSTPGEGPHAGAIRKALGFVCAEVEAAPEAGLPVTAIQGTRVQGKIGQHVDTFLAAMLLAETRGKMPDEAGNKRVTAALDKAMDKIEKNQKADGTWDNRGWAPVLSQGLATKAMNRVVVFGGRVSEDTIVRGQAQAQIAMSGSPVAGEPPATAATIAGVPAAGPAARPGDAGVGLYSAGANYATLADTAGNAGVLEERYKEKLRDAKTEAEKQDAEQKLGQVAQMKTAETDARKSVISSLDNPGFVSGFGSNGGEEFLSYMNISESLAKDGGKDWEKWNGSMQQNLARIQNDDGSWTGHHCITGRTFCTAAALLVLTADRAPFPVADRVARR